MKKFISVFQNLLKLSKVEFSKTSEYNESEASDFIIEFRRNQLKPVVDLLSKLSFAPDPEDANSADEFIKLFENQTSAELISEKYAFSVEIWNNNRGYFLSFSADNDWEDNDWEDAEEEDEEISKDDGDDDDCDDGDDGDWEDD